MKSTVAIHQILVFFVTEELSSSLLCYCFGSQASWVNVDTIDLWQIQEKPRHSTFCGQAQERIEPESRFAAKACYYFRSSTWKLIQKQMFLLKSAVLKSTDETPLERVVVTASGRVHTWTRCVFVYMFMHACERTLLLCDGSCADSQQKLCTFWFSKCRSFSVC